MNMISEIKEDVRTLLIACGVIRGSVHFHAADEQSALSKRAYPFATVLTGDEKFTNDYDDYTRGVRIMPMEVRVHAQHERACMDIVEQLYARMPVRWQYDGRTGEVAIMGATHSDHVAKITQYYACFIELNFTMQVHRVITP